VKGEEVESSGCPSLIEEKKRSLKKNDKGKKKKKEGSRGGIVLSLKQERKGGLGGEEAGTKLRLMDYERRGGKKRNASL